MSVFHPACCSLEKVVINGSSHSVCSRQALLLPLPRWATHTSLTPSQEQANISLCEANRNENWRNRDGGGTGEPGEAREIKIE